MNPFEEIKMEIDIIKNILNEKLNKLEEMIDSIHNNNVLTCDICNNKRFNVSRVSCCGKNLAEWYCQEDINVCYNCNVKDYKCNHKLYYS